MFMRSAAMVALRGRLAAPSWEARGRSRRARGGLFGRWRRFALLQAAGARGALASAVEAKGLYRQALKPVGLDAAGLGVSSADCKAAS